MRSRMISGESSIGEDRMGRVKNNTIIKNYGLDI